jgi:predicted transcriptional regulator
MKPVTTARQELLCVRLYTNDGWSVAQIASVVGLGRRAVENALHRRGVTMKHNRTVEITEETRRSVQAMFVAAGKLFDDPNAPYHVITMTEIGHVVYRRRRCQSCGAINEYAIICHFCNASFTYDAPSRLDIDIEQTRKDLENRGYSC